MGYSAEVIQRARARLEQARADREAENRQHLETAYREVPRIRQIDQQLRQTMASAMQAAFAKGTDVRQAMDAIRQENLRLEQEIGQLKTRQEENDRESAQMEQQLQQLLADRASAEAAKTKAERESQEKSKDILNMERACALLEQKKVTTGMEEGQIIDKLWDSYGLTPGTAVEHRGEIESVATGNRRASELKRKISALGTPNLGAIEEYARVNERYSYLAEQRDDVLNSKREL